MNINKFQKATMKKSRKPNSIALDAQLNGKRLRKMTNQKSKCF